MKWEYRIVKHTSGSQNDRTHNLIRFNEIGQEGWELVSVDNGIAYFKRINREWEQEIIKKQMGTPPFEGIQSQVKTEHIDAR